MKCSKTQELFSSYLEKTIQPPMGVAFEQHLAECAHCKAAYDRFHATAVVLDELPVAEPPPDLHQVIMARVERARREAPGRVKWLRFDWQSAFTFRVSAKALTATAAMLLVFVMAMQFTPLTSYMSGIVGVQRAVTSLPDETGFVPQPTPAGLSSVKYADVGAGLRLGVSVDRTDNNAGTVYDIRLTSAAGTPIPVQVYELPEGSVGSNLSSSDLTSVRCIGTLTNGKDMAARIFQADSDNWTKVAVVVWKSQGQSLSELVYLPPKFETSPKNGTALANMDICQMLGQLSADYGAVVIAPARCGSMTGSVSTTATRSDRAMAEVAQQSGLDIHRLSPSIYVVR